MERSGRLWTTDEDEILISYIKSHGEGNWNSIPKDAGLRGRTGKSCRLRWANYLRPGRMLGSFTKEEDDHIIELHSRLGNKWSAIASHLPGRTDNDVKNNWHVRIKRVLDRRGNGLKNTHDREHVCTCMTLSSTNSNACKCRDIDGW